MPYSRLLGNAALSFITKLSTGYWEAFDPTNGFLAIHARTAATLPLDKLSRGYFFETDLLFRLNTYNCVVMDIPMAARYGKEQSGLVPAKVVGPFLVGHAKNLCKRIFYRYFLRDFSVASLHLILGLSMLGFGVTFGLNAWLESATTEVFSSAGTVMLASLPTILGVQFLIAFLNYDMAPTFNLPLHRRLYDRVLNLDE